MLSNSLISIHPSKETACIASNSNGSPFNTCKETCTTDDCNKNEPGFDLDSTPPNSCLVCSVTVDSFNNTIGSGDEGCWDGDQKYTKQCDSDLGSPNCEW